MKSKVKRILSIVMTVCIVSTMIPLTAYGADVDFGDDTTVAAEESEDNISASDLEQMKMRTPQMCLWKRMTVKL